MVHARHFVWTGLVVVALAWLGGYPSLAEGTARIIVGDGGVAGWVRLLGILGAVPLAVTTVAAAWRWTPPTRRRPQ